MVTAIFITFSTESIKYLKFVVTRSNVYYSGIPRIYVLFISWSIRLAYVTSKIGSPKIGMVGFSSIVVVILGA